ncbi:MAG: hypothetical protein ABFD89_02220 [Bryobacteraceae bacterium]
MDVKTSDNFISITVALREKLIYQEGYKQGLLDGYLLACGTTPGAKYELVPDGSGFLRKDEVKS